MIMAPKKVNFTEDTFVQQPQQEYLEDDDDCRSHVSCETEYTFETVQTGYTYETVYTEVTEVTEAQQVEPREAAPENTSSSSSSSRVWFNPRIEVQETLSLDDYTTKETKATWYNEDDKAKLNARRMRVVTRMENGKARPRRGQTYRGLECSSTEGSRRLRETVARHVDSVMDEQDRQWRLFIEEPEMIALVSRHTSGASKLQAFELACQDAEAAAELAVAGEDLSSSESGNSEDILEEEPPSPVAVPAAVEAAPKQPRRRSSTSKESTKKRSKKGRRKNDPPGKDTTRHATFSDQIVLEQMANNLQQFKNGSSQKAPPAIPTRRPSTSKIRR